MKELLEELIKKSLDDLYNNDIYLIDHQVSERSLMCHFAHYFMNHMCDTAIASYNVDCEYNRDGYEAKLIGKNRIFPDFIVHRRGTNDDNLLVIEFKTWWNVNNENDIVKLQNMMSERYRYQYQYACSIILHQDREHVNIIYV